MGGDKGREKEKKGKWTSVHLYMMGSEEKLTIEVGLFYKIWVCDAYLRIDRCRVQGLTK